MPLTSPLTVYPLNVTTYDFLFIFHYSAWREFYETVLEPRLYDPAPRRDPGELGPEAVTAKLIHALESPKPKARYYVTRTTYLARLFRILVPVGARDRLLQRYF